MPARSPATGAASTAPVIARPRRLAGLRRWLQGLDDDSLPPYTYHVGDW